MITLSHVSSHIVIEVQVTCPRCLVTSIYATGEAIHNIVPIFLMNNQLPLIPVHVCCERLLNMLIHTDYTRMHYINC